MTSTHERFASCAVTIQRAPADLFAYWENPILLPTILRHLHGRFEEEGESTYVGAGLGVATLMVAQRVPNRLLEWVARADDEVLYRALASFRPAPADRGTELRFSLELPEESGTVRRVLDTLRGRDPAFLLREDLRNFKQFMETGEYPTTRGQPTGRRSLRGRALTSLIGEKLQRELSQGEAQLRPLVAASSGRAGASA
jgi:uncharacterized membrane protein